MNTTKLYEGKAKLVLRVENKSYLIQRFKDDATAFNGEKAGNFSGKGELNNRISSTIFRYLAAQNIPSHYIETINARDMKIEEVSIIPLEVVLRNVVAGSLAKRTGLPEGTKLKRPIIEFYYKRDDLGDPMLALEHIEVLELATKQEVQELQKLGFAINDALLPMWKKCGLNLVDFKLEFGRKDGKILLADEISPDTSRLWDLENQRKMDKDVFRRDLADLVSTYEEVYARLQRAYANFTPGELKQI